MTHDPAFALPRSTPEQQGIASAALLGWVDALDRQVHELHSLMLVRHGYVVAEGWWSPYRAQEPHLVFSLSKSFTATAVGLAVAEGAVTLDDPVLAYFPAAAPAADDAHSAALRVHHLLSMTTGHDTDTWWHMQNRPDGDWSRGFFDVPLRHAPGTHFLYNTGASYMLSAIVQKVTGQTLVDYLQPRLFEPLGIARPSWQQSPQGICAGGLGLSLRTEDIARFGQLYLQNGLWQGRRLLPEGWVEAATGFQTATGDDPASDWTQGYGYQFWRSRHNAYRGDGVFGQFCVVMPDQDAVLAMTGGVDLGDMQGPLELLWELVLPAMQANPLPESADTQRLTDRLASLSLPPEEGRASSPLASAVSGHTYHMDENALAIRALALRFDESECVLSITTPTGEEIMNCGHGVWRAGQTSVFNHLWLDGLNPVLSSGAWLADDRYRLVARLIQTPFVQTLTFHFDGGELMVEVEVNVSFEPASHLLTGRVAGQ